MNLYLFQRIIGTCVLLLQIAIVLFVGYLIYRKVTGKTCTFIEKLFGDYSLWLVFIFGLFAVIGSLLFSEVYHVEPCKLCWFQRSFVYPSALIAGIAAFKQDFMAKSYLFWMSAIGMVIAVYQALAQFGAKAIPLLPCVAEAGADCAKITMLEYGYITIPVMSATLFLAIILITTFKKKAA